ncbi:hypothetical protein FBU30_000171 [Linnemannia zychae]|nr:hypothetical protein FBU30_000171 [Linnemannia zychae]
MKEFRPILYNPYYIAFSVETSFSVNGPSVTRAGFLTYLRAMIMSDPDEAFKDFTTLSQAMQLRHQFSRSQFLRVADPKAKSIDNNIKAYILKALTDIAMKVHQTVFCDICFNTVAGSYHACQDCDDYVACQDCFALAPKRHNPIHRFKSTGSAQEMIHEGIQCDICLNTIVGVRHKCMNCGDYDLCQKCIALAPERHISGHRFEAIERSAASYEEELNAVKVRIALEQMGQEAALDLLTPSICYRCRMYSCICRR